MSLARTSVLAGALVLAPPAQARTEISLDIPAGRLRDGVAALSLQARASIAIADAELGRLQTPPVSGRMTTEHALRRMTRGLPVNILVIDSSTFRVVRSRGRRPPPLPRARPAATFRPIIKAPEPQIIVITASKRQTAESRYAGSVLIVPSDGLGFGGAAGTETIERAATSLSSTHLGQGRDKLFLRGVADSSFSGHTQGTVGQYLGEVRLNYSGPDPDLRLYDVARTEILPGPQGTLYGAGSMGGVIRIEPNAPDPSGVAAEGILSFSRPRSGAMGGEAAAMLNLPITGDDGAVRLVGYRVREGGYIDDVGRAVANSNDTLISGARAGLALEPAEGLRVGLLGALQTIDGRDATYADRRLPPYSRTAAVAQPYATRFRLGAFSLERERGELGVVASLGYTHSRLRDLFDASQSLPDTHFLTRHDASRLVTAEARIRRTGDVGVGWLAGTAFTDSRTRFASTLYYKDGAQLGSTAETTTREFILFGEVSRNFGAAAVTVGARAARWTSGSRTSARDGRPAFFDVAAGGLRFLPSVSALVPLAGDVRLFVRHGSSYRPPTAAASPGGLSILSGDRYSALEFGISLPRTDERSLSGSVSVTSGRWHDVQADVIDNSGFLSATNVGYARIASVEAAIGWRVSDALRLDAGASFNRTRLTPDLPGIINMAEARLPNVPDVAARLGLAYQTSSGARLPLRASTRLRYTGRSRLGVGPDLGRWQGGFTDMAADIQIGGAGTQWFIGVTNLLGSSGNRFALGSIVQAGTENLYVPQAPRTIRVGVKLGWQGARLP